MSSMVTRGQANRTANDNPQPGGGGVAGGGPGGGDGGIDDDTLMVDADAMPPAMDEAIRALTAIGFSAATRDILLDVAKEGLKPKDLSIMRDEEAHSLVVRLVKMKVANMEPLYVNVRTESSLKTACYIARHYKRTGRTFDWSVITPHALEAWKVFQNSEADHQEPTEPLKLLHSTDVAINEFIERFPEILLQYNGTDGRPLSYIVRTNEKVPEESSDPPVTDPASTYENVRDEVAARAKISNKDTGYLIDNRRVFTLLTAALQAFPTIYVWVKGYIRTI
mmetsp:Transcript_36513/g.88171  ORF Transcript_36513/g.88171 Transcript_36513/m.88171 type:complete len:280 (-) Transcript_36513:627-1466(-)